MRRVGRIVDVPATGVVTVELESGVACARCASGRGCGAALFAPAGRPLRLDCALERADDGRATPGARIGARVEVTVHGEGSRWLVPVALAYGLPTLGLLVGSLAPEPWTPLAAFAGLGGGLLAWRVSNARIGPAREGPCRPVARTTAGPCASRAERAIAVAAPTDGHRSPSREKSA